jgi:DNA-binding XRE family transcriptional regulator
MFLAPFGTWWYVSGMNGSKDLLAGQLLKELREDRGLSREALPLAMLKAGVARDYIPCARTVAYIEMGRIPRVRVKFGLAQFFGVSVRDIWGTPSVTRRLAA